MSYRVEHSKIKFISTRRHVISSIHILYSYPLHAVLVLLKSQTFCIVQIRAFWLVLSWSGFRHTDRFRGNGHELRIFCLWKPLKFKTNMARVPYNKLLTNLACSSHTEEYWPSVVLVRTSLRSVRTATTSGQYSPVPPSPSVSKRLICTLFTVVHSWIKTTAKKTLAFHNDHQTQTKYELPEKV